MTNPIVLWNVDAQNDFFDAPFDDAGEKVSWELPRFSRPSATKPVSGKIYDPGLAVPGSDYIRPHLQSLHEYAQKTPDWRVMGSMDNHTEADVKHLGKWPKHCMKGTPGQYLIEEIRTGKEGWIPLEALSADELEKRIRGASGSVYFEKHERPEDTDPDACNSCRVNPNVAPALTLLQPKVIALTGVALGYCIKEARDYFKELGYKVALVTDAIKEFSADELSLYGTWKEEGDLLVHTSDVLAGRLEELLK